MPVFDPYKYVSDLGVAQRQAGVDRVVRELVCAYAKLAVEEGQPPVFYSESISEKDLSLCPEVVDVQTRCSALDLRFLDFLSRYAGDLREKDLPPVFDRYQLASFLDINMKQLVHLTHNQPGYYKQFKIPKRSGGSRFIDAPKYQLKNIHRKILWDILYHIPCERAAKGFISGTSIRDNAELHVGKRVVLRIDLENFFPSITFKQVRKVFEKIGYPYSVSLALANICTLKGKLPQGAPTSPAISNLVCRTLDRRFQKLADKKKITYTRYADDLVFSSDDQKLPKIIPLVREIVKSEGFRVNEKKVSVMRSNQRQMVTGIVVNERLNIPKMQLRQLRAAAHRYQPEGGRPVELKSKTKKTADPVHVLDGRLAFVKMIDPQKGHRLLGIKNA